MSFHRSPLHHKTAQNDNEKVVQSDTVETVAKLTVRYDAQKDDIIKHSGMGSRERQERTEKPGTVVVNLSKNLSICQKTKSSR